MIVRFVRVGPLSHSRNRRNVHVLAPNQAIPAMVGRDRKPACDGARRKILAVASCARQDNRRRDGRPCGRRAQPNGADERTDAIKRRLRPAVWPVALSPPIDPKRSSPQPDPARRGGATATETAENGVRWRASKHKDKLNEEQSPSTAGQQSGDTRTPAALLPPPTGRYLG